LPLGRWNVAKSKAASKKKKRNFIVRYFREASTELRKVNWPSRQEATRLTVIVLVVVAVMSGLLGVLDFLFTRFFGLIYSLG
jgi:preprotein translocase subunit SecE